MPNIKTEKKTARILSKMARPNYSKYSANAYCLKESFYEFTDSRSAGEAEQQLKEFLFKAKVLDLVEFKPCIRVLENRRKYILNAFDCTYSNGYTEGINNSFKVLKKLLTASETSIISELAFYILTERMQNRPGLPERFVYNFLVCSIPTIDNEPF